jgi:hypothetical protein
VTVASEVLPAAKLHAQTAARFEPPPESPVFAEQKMSSNIKKSSQY